MNIRPLDYDLNRLVMALAPPHVARSMAPDTLPALYAAASNGGPLPVYDGHSETTIYGDAKVNHAFRAWHDAAHIAGGFAFDLAGEIAACRYQVAQARERFPLVPARLLRYVEAEIIGQAEHYALTGAFPLDQIAFFRSYAQ